MRAVAPTSGGAATVARLSPLAACSFVVATDGTLVVGLLGRIGRTISAIPAATGQGITAFAVAYALGSPAVVAATRRWPAKLLLLLGLLVFVGANAATGAAASLAGFLAARAIAGLAAGLVTPTAASIASASSGDDERGRVVYRRWGCLNGGGDRCTAGDCSPRLSALRRVLSFAVRRGYLSTNPCGSLERGKRPSTRAGGVVVLEADELQRLLDAADAAARPMLATAALSGLRQSELLALRWEDIDFDAELIRVRHQLSRGSASSPARLVPLKTDSSAREVVLVPALATILRERREKALASGHHSPGSFVFCTRDGKPLAQRNATRSLARIAGKAKLDGIGFHVLRHGFASTLIVELRLDPVVVSRQLGHARPSITLDRYSHLFNRARHADDLRERLQASELAAAVSRS